MALVIESTGRCQRTKLLLLAMEERSSGAEPYELVRREAGYFEATAHRIGPWVTVQGRTYQELNLSFRAVARACGWWPSDVEHAEAIESWLELQATWLRPSAVSAYHAMGRGASAPDAEEIFQRALQCLNHRLKDHDFLTESFSVADCALWFLSAVTEAGLPLGDIPHLLAAVRRLEERPAAARALARLSEFEHSPIVTS